MALGKRKSPLGDKQNDLDHQEADIKRQVEALQNLIETAPQKIEAQKKRRRDQLIDRAACDGNRLDVPASLQGDIFSNTRSSSKKNRPRLKSEKQALRLRFLGLFILFAVLFALLLSMLSEFF